MQKIDSLTNDVLRRICYRVGFLPGERCEMLDRLNTVSPEVLSRAIREVRRDMKIRRL